MIFDRGRGRAWDRLHPQYYHSSCNLQICYTQFWHVAARERGRAWGVVWIVKHTNLIIWNRLQSAFYLPGVVVFQKSCVSNQDLHYLFVLFVLECKPVIFLISLRLLYVLKYMCMCVYYSLWNLHLLHTWLLILVHIYYVHLYLLFVCVLTIVSIQQIGRRYGYKEMKLNSRHGM